jgi:hypothetical protein
MREIKMEFDLPRNPFVQHAWTTKHYLYLTRDDTRLSIAIVDTQINLPFAETFEFQETLEIKSPSP